MDKDEQGGSQGAGANANEAASQRTILRACHTGDVTVLKRFVHFGLAASNPDMLAADAYFGHVVLVKFLVKELGADVN